MQETKKTLPSIKEFKDEAKELRLQDKSIPNHGQALNKLARVYGFNDWNTIRPQLREDKE